MPSEINGHALVSEYAAALDVDGLACVFCDEEKSVSVRKSAMQRLFRILASDPFTVALGTAFLRFQGEVLDKMATAEFLPERQRLLLGKERASRFLIRGNESGLAGIEANPKHLPAVRTMAREWLAMLKKGEAPRRLWNAWQDKEWAKVQPAKLRAWLV